MAASASFWEYGSSRSCFTLPHCQLQCSGGLLLSAGFSPPLVHFALLVSGHVGLALKELCAFLAVILAQAWQIFYRLCIFKLGQVLLVAQVGVHLVEIAGVPTSLLLGVLTAYGWHGGLYPRPSAMGRAIVNVSAIAMQQWRRFGLQTKRAVRPCLQVGRILHGIESGPLANATSPAGPRLRRSADHFSGASTLLGRIFGHCACCLRRGQCALSLQSASLALEKGKCAGCCCLL